jgi:hypothetical protein
VLAVATFGATRSANRASFYAERSLQAALRPVLAHAQLGDPRQKIGYADQHWVHVEGPSAVFEELNDVIYLAFGLRNAGSGIAVLTGWHPAPERITGGVPHAPVENFRPQTRTLYVPPGGLGFWQGALRDPTDPVYAGFAEAARNREPVTIEIMYADMDGGQQAITRLTLLPGHGDGWVAAVGKHWMLNGQVTSGRRRARDSAARR